MKKIRTIQKNDNRAVSIRYWHPNMVRLEFEDVLSDKKV